MRERLRVVAQLARFLWSERVWWMVPIAVGIIIIGALTLLGASSPLAPFLYPLF